MKLNATVKNLIEVISSSSSSSSKDPKTILITGCNSGVGLLASKLLRASNPGHQLLLVARSLEKAQVAADQVDQFLNDCHGSLQSGEVKNAKIFPMACEQSSLESVKNFCEELRTVLAARKWKLDVVCLNAAMIRPSKSDALFTEDDLEITFQTNHLAPFMMANLLADQLASDARVVVTSSSLHDGPLFKGFGGMVNDSTASPTAKHRFEMVNGDEFHNHKAYAMSKLCNSTFCLELNRRLALRNGNQKAVFFSPGLIPTTGLFRHSGTLMRPIFQFAMGTVFGVSSTEEWGGGALAWMAMSDTPQGGEYYATPKGSTHFEPTYGESFCPALAPDEAASRKNQEMLWKLSAELCGIDPNLIPSK